LRVVEALVGGLIGLGFALLLGWLAWGRPLGVARAAAAARDAEFVGLRADLDAKAERFNAAIRDLAAMAEQVKAIEPLRAENASLLAAREELAALKSAQAERDRAHAEQKAQLVATGDALKAQFEQLADATLRKSQTQFIEMATETFKAQQAKAEAGLATNKAQLAELIAPMRDTLGKYEARLAEVEAARTESYGKLTQLLDQVSKGQERVSGETLKLATALRSSGKVAGRWGEEQCRNVLELAGLVEGVDFLAQSSVDGEGGKLRPDFTVTLPGERRLVIDVKCSLDAFYAAAEADGDNERGRHLKAHAAAIRAHANGLAGKAYEKSVGGAVDFVVLFVPGENFLAAAIEQDRALMNDFMARRLVLAGPINLIAVARTVAAMRDQARLAKEAAEIGKLGKEIYESLRIMGGNIMNVQRSLDGAVTSFNKFVSQMDSRVISRARKFEQLGPTTGLEPIPELRPIEALPITSTAPELAPPLAPETAVIATSHAAE
jgi:DNA recombination protein RmuC